ncbi:MAG: glycosyltransferase family 4 protein [Corynebacterium sp.]|uniref:glycosyltransferase family 4 protein n=1 Tax=Corynebacterium sp. TaxID=1720 RepID=UPI0026DEDB4A|nr:glycosyltransferase family 4 protein [Corynebacterium sp.]MDO5668794.1 glycosyltransferase family 4 protein [Corynebacterium sp.]
MHRILHFLTNSEPFTISGYTVRSTHVLACQQAQGIQVLGVTRLGYPVLVGKFPPSHRQTVGGNCFHRLLPWIYPRSLVRRNEVAVAKLVAVAREFGATVLHTTTDFSNAVVVAEAARQLSIPWVYEARGELESTWLSRFPEEQRDEAASSEFYLAARSMETRCMQAAGGVVALSEVSRGQMVERGVPSEKITVIPNAVDKEVIGREFDQSAIRRELSLPVGAKIVGTVTAVVDYEGLDVLLRALEYLPPEYLILVVGDGTARPDLEAVADEIGVADRVIFVGRQPNSDIWRWYAALDVFVVPRKDTHVTRTVTPIKPLTAMALGIPVVASDLPALREVTGQKAIYVRAENPEDLARGIVESYGTHQSGPEWAAKRTWSANGRRYKELYDSL